MRKELMDMFTARKARELSDATFLLVTKRLVRKITRLAKRASKKGKYAIGYETFYSYPIRERISLELRKLGYDVHIGHSNTIIKVFW
jgi:hypothetical protein